MAKVDLFPDFKELLESLNSEGVRYLVLGGYAVIHYGYRRATDDLDVWIAVDDENSEKVSRDVEIRRIFRVESQAQHVPHEGQSVHLRARAGSG